MSEPKYYSSEFGLFFLNEEILILKKIQFRRAKAPDFIHRLIMHPDSPTKLFLNFNFEFAEIFEFETCSPGSDPHWV